MGLLGGLVGKVAERWIDAVLTSALLFWTGGAVVWAAHAGGRSAWSQALRQFDQASPGGQLLVVVGGLVAVTASGSIVRWLAAPVVPWLEGYWPAQLAQPRRWLIRWHAHRLDRARDRWGNLASRLDSVSAEEYHEYVQLDGRLRRLPANHHRLMPTRLGNVLRSTETRLWDKYGLDAVKCWPQMWLVAPEEARQQLAAARQTLDTGAVALVWAILFLAWTPWAWWAPAVTLAVAVGAYRRILTNASVYADLVEATFDVHRTALYAALRWPAPANPAEERPLGRSLTEALWRGADAPTPQYRPQDEQL